LAWRAQRTLQADGAHKRFGMRGKIALALLARMRYRASASRLCCVTTSRDIALPSFAAVPALALWRRIISARRAHRASALNGGIRIVL